jgi:hypothetical protein
MMGFRQVFTLEKRTEMTTSRGRKMTGWVFDGLYMGQLDFLAGRRGEQSAKFVDTSTHMLFCRANVPIEDGDRVQIREEFYRVNHVDNPMWRNRFFQVELEVWRDGIQQPDS